MGVFNDYAHYYDLLYRDKDYFKESEYVHSLIQKYAPHTKSILDLGCGTGLHAEYLLNHSYTIHGIDQSKEMIEKAEKRIMNLPDEFRPRLSFSLADVRHFTVDQKFDTIISLFHVISYQSTNDDLEKAIETASKHLNAGGIFIFDFWYGAAVLSDPPVVRVKRIEDENIQLTRVAEPTMLSTDNLVRVDYQMFVREKHSDKFTEIKESHNMRYLFIPELEYICNKAGFKTESRYKWLTFEQPDLSSWNVCMVVRK